MSKKQVNVVLNKQKQHLSISVSELNMKTRSMILKCDEVESLVTQLADIMEKKVDEEEADLAEKKAQQDKDGAGDENDEE